MNGNEKLEAAAVTAGFKAAVVVGLLGLALVIAGESMRAKEEGAKTGPIAPGASANAIGSASQAAGRRHTAGTESAKLPGATSRGKTER